MNRPAADPRERDALFDHVVGARRSPRVYGPADAPPARGLGAPGEFPFTRGVHPTGYRGRLWTMRQYAGFGIGGRDQQALPLPARAGPDRPLGGVRSADADGLRPGRADRARRGRQGRRLHRLARGHAATSSRAIPLDRVSTSMTINATASILLALYVAVARRQGVAPATLSGTMQNDILKEYIARGTYIFPPRPSMRLITDIFAYCKDAVPRWNTISISGYHMREAGCTAVQEVAFTLANGDRLRAGGRRGRASPSTTSRRSSPSSSTRTTTSSRRWRSSARRGGCGRGSCASASAPAIRARWRSASTRRRRGAC